VTCVTSSVPDGAQPFVPAPRPIAVVDIDGVVADARHRLAHLTVRPKDWDGFFADAVHDPVLPEGRAVVQHLVDAGHEIVWLTGRPERCRTDTTDWLHRHGLPDGRLFMRADNDRRPARMTKLAELRTLASTGDIAIMVDDDEEVARTVREAGFPVLHADWMNKSETPGSGTDAHTSTKTGSTAAETLFEAQEVDGRT
jgi:hypothetical protein